MHQADPEDEILALPVRWRALAMTVAYFAVLLLAVGLGQMVIARLFHGADASDRALDLFPWLVCGLIAGLVVGLIDMLRRPRGIRLTGTDLEVPRFWRGGIRRLSRDEIDTAASLPRRVPDVLLRRDVIPSRIGKSLSIYRWSYSARDVRRIEAALGISVEADGRGM